MEVLVRTAALHRYLDLCDTLGTDGKELLRRAGLDATALSDQDRWVPALAVARLLELSADACRREDFGLQLARLRRLSNLGPISLLVREQPDVRGVLQLLTRYEGMYNPCLHASLSEAGGVATLRIRLDIPGSGSIRQASELAVGAYHRVLAEFLGPHDRPLAVYFMHPAPLDTRPYRSVFGIAPEFDAALDGIAVRAEALDAANEGADEILRRYARSYLESLGLGAEPSDVERIRKIIEILLPTGDCSVEQVARATGIDRRTVHRRLATVGENFSSVLDAARVDLARRYVAESRRSMTDIAHLLGFASASAFSRWFRDRFDMSPTRWRSSRA